MTKWLIIVSLLILTACAEPTKQLTPLANNAVIVAFGDSLTLGVGSSKQYSYPSVLAQKTGLTVVNAGISGEISAQGLKRLPQVLAKYQPQLVILCHGGNDLLRKLSSAQTKANLKQMIELIRQTNAEVVLLAVPKPGLVLAAADYYQQLTTELDLVSDLTTISQLQTKPNHKSDTVHFNQLGYAKLADAVMNLLIEYGAYNG